MHWNPPFLEPAWEMEIAVLKGGLFLNVVFLPFNTSLIEISRPCFEQSGNSIFTTQFYVLGLFVSLWVILGYIWGELVFLKGLIKSGEILKKF